MTLRTSLSLYDVDVRNYEDFSVEVFDCIPTLFSNGASISDIQHVWGLNESTYDVSNLVNSFSQSPQCGYPILFQAYLYDNGSTQSLSTVSEVTFYEEANVFAFEKCGPINGPDSECDDYQYTKSIPIRLVARAG